jgi:hypothetical protein
MFPEIGHGILTGRRRLVAVKYMFQPRVLPNTVKQLKS